RCVQETLINGSESGEKWMRIHYSRENTPAGALETLVAIYEDITAEKESARAAEHRRQQLIRADRMSTLGTLTAGTAHEISNPNQVILGNAELAEETWSGLRRELQISDEKMSRYISRIVEGARRIDGIVENLKSYVRSAEAPGPELMNVNEAAMRAASLLDQIIEKSTAGFSIDLEPNLPPVSANPGRIEQVAVNFLMNACQALQDRSKNITLRTRHEGQYVTMEVADEGSGISEDLIDKITDPFVTSRRENGGTGLGLSVCDGIARDYNGILDFANRPEGGAVVRLHLPVAVF
ncbi:MAG: ATP-binding protein, partial [Spirochaetaceae bacterium]|nr:ATP-binding protein [Spirochaetaceae bacterium]